ncbi:MAG: 2-amino-4-hydroxy-6-hydroxymethyldihydropteridine diphosphokinase [Ignavibacteria bacterium]|nr:2-amino-4-hydroxy-6-hydroxymethyldihydropteridine diphosphokinase [Bacteroidota bacterium]MBL7128821.1 2-amino-4-hydroxy-6-hydroxymethyldihydropteridine diphosphokinase [Ignavibacteria bacterium]
MTRVYLGLGSNVGDRYKFIIRAIEEIEKIQGVNLISKSSVYETEPWGNKEQNRFLNSVIEVNSNLEPLKLFRELKRIEKRLGRMKNIKWAEREIDIDILFYDDDIIRNDTLEIPHHEIEKRRFVLVPLEEIASNFIHPVFNKTILELLESTDDISEVNMYDCTYA